MGQKIHPIGFRLGVFRDWDSRWYADKDFAKLLLEDAKIRKYVKKTLFSSGISKTEIERAANKVKITIFTAKPGLIIGRGGKGVDDLRAELEKLTLGKTVHVNVQEIRQPELDAQLVAENIAQQIEKRVSHKRAIKQAVLRATRLNTKGIKIRVAGRLGGAEMARIENDKFGKIPLHTLRAYIDYGFYEAATTYGNIGIKVWIYKGDVNPNERKVEVTEEELLAQRRPRRTTRGGDRPSGGRGGADRSGGGGRGRGARGGGERGTTRNANA